MDVKRLTAKIAATIMVTVGAGFAALADNPVGQPKDGGLWLQEPASKNAQRVYDFNVELMIIITVITLFVFALMFYTMWRFRAKKNPVPSKVTHHVGLEIAWTVLPIFILLAIGVKSLPLLYYQDVVPETEFAIEVTGNRWNWTYRYPDHAGIEFTSVLVTDEEHADAALKADAEAELTAFLGFPGKLNARLLDTDNRLVVPVDTKIKVLLSASDVLHAWALPAFGVKLDAVPGRINETWFEAAQTGTFYGQCSELCGKDHAYMPIAIEVVSKEEFAKWVEHAKVNYADASVTALGR
ncbi:MAG: cytochrome c oxidase subunit II [Kordiimonadaceae bacterium]|nr:cytochrome c oxidase subunit II [Kordiimonadaceae bacterium]